MKIRDDFLPVLRPVGGDEEIKSIAETIKSGWWGKGPKVEEFEQEFAKLVGAKHAIAVTSNSHGQDLVMKAMGFKNIDVINPTMYFVATAQIPLWNGCTSNIVDVDKINQAIKDSNLEKFVNSLPDKLDTKVGERGIKLSAGQRQRIGIARTLYYDPQVIIFEEATSNLDLENEEKIIELVSSFKKNKTILIVSHRISALKNCNLIYQFIKGELKKQN